MAGLAVKVPVFPLHTWLPPAHTTAPDGRLGAAGGGAAQDGHLRPGAARRWPRCPTASPRSHRCSPSLGAVGIIWGGLACLVERDLKRLVAYSSVAHMGFVVLGLASGTRTGLQAALFANVAHGVISALLFVVVGGLKERWGSADLETARAALREVTPRLGFALVVGLAASLGLPGLAGFWGEFLSVYAAWSPAADRPAGLFRTAGRRGRGRHGAGRRLRAAGGPDRLGGRAHRAARSRTAATASGTSSPCSCWPSSSSASRPVRCSP